jgi:hypothetical protein
MTAPAPRCSAVIEAGYFPKHQWLARLAEGWRWPGDVAEEMRGPGGHYSVVLVREEVRSA